MKAPSTTTFKTVPQKSSNDVQADVVVGRVSQWALLILAAAMAVCAAWCAWTVVTQPASSDLLLLFAAFLVHKAIVILGCFALGPEPEAVRALFVSGFGKLVDAMNARNHVL